MLKFINVSDEPEILKNVRQLYKTSFPAAERAPLFLLKAKAKKDFADFFGIYDEDVFVGLLYQVKFEDCLYVFYLAINPQLRGKGYGSKTLDYVKQTNKGLRIMLNIEPLDKDSSNYDERVKRREFYRKNGFEDTDTITKEGGVKYLLLQCGGTVHYDDYAKLMKNYWGALLFKLFFKKIDA